MFDDQRTRVINELPASPDPVPVVAPASAALPAAGEVPTSVEAPASPVSLAIDAWFAKHFHGLGPHLTEYLHSRLLAAVADLKTLLLELPIS